MQCFVCGGSEFIQDAGRQSCIECGTINTNYVDVQIDGDHNLTTCKTAKLRIVEFKNKEEIAKNKKIYEDKLNGKYSFRVLV